MEKEEKINAIGRMVADINLNVNLNKRRIEEIREWLLFPEKLKIKQEVEEAMKRSNAFE